MKLLNLIFVLCFCVGIHSQSDSSLPKESVIPDNDYSLKEEVALVRNEIYARHGREFKTPKYIKFFSKFDWYNVNTNYDDSLLTPEDLRDVKILRSYEEELNKLSDPAKEFLKDVLRLIKKFRYRDIDTTIVSIGNINGDSFIDTVRTIIYEKSNEIVVTYVWESEHELMWEHSYKNPYMYVDESNLFQYDTRDLWVTFSIAVKYCVFKFENQDRYKHIDRNMATSIGWSKLKELGISISKEEYRKYLEEFGGQLVYYGQEEGGGNLDIWYNPIGKFIPFYRP